MNLNKTIDLIKKHEGFSKTVYRCPTGFLTVGYGRNLETRGITDEEAEILLINDISDIITSLKVRIDFWESLPEEAKEVLVNMAYNIGVYGLLNFKKFLSFLRVNDFELASKEMLDSKWATQVGNRAIELSEMINSLAKKET